MYEIYKYSLLKYLPQRQKSGLYQIMENAIEFGLIEVALHKAFNQHKFYRKM